MFVVENKNEGLIVAFKENDEKDSILYMGTLVQLCDSDIAIHSWHSSWERHLRYDIKFQFQKCLKLNKCWFPTLRPILRISLNYFLYSHKVEGLTGILNSIHVILESKSKNFHFFFNTRWFFLFNLSETALQGRWQTLVLHWRGGDASEIFFICIYAHVF